VIAARPESRTAIRRAGEHLAPSDGRLDSWYAAYVDTSHERLAIDLDLLQQLDPAHSTHVLDVGASPPLLLAALVANGWRATGIDIDPSRFARSAAALGFEVVGCDIEREPLPFADGAFDVIVMNEVFEHLRIDLIATMTEISRVLAPFGVLCMSTPNARSSRGITNFLLRGKTGWCGSGDIYAQYEKLHTLGHMGHVREYTVREVQEFMRHIDLSLETVVWRHRDRRAIYRVAATVLPPLSPFMSLVLRKQGRRPDLGKSGGNPRSAISRGQRRYLSHGVAGSRHDQL
jgi:SAM-dependent methyltransferase